MIITLPNADFSTAGIGQVIRLVNGMPISGLSALYLLDSGTVGDAVSTLYDSSGNGNDAVLRTNWTGATQKSYGLSVDSSDGVCYTTPLSANQSSKKFTVIVAGSNTLPGSESGVYNTWVGASDNIDMSLPTSNHSNGPGLALNFDGSSSGRWQAFDLSSDAMGQAVLYNTSGAEISEPAIVALTVDGEDGDVLISEYISSYISNELTGQSGVQTLYDGSTDLGFIDIGIWGQGLTRSANTTIGEIYAVAIYTGELTESEIQTRMTYMKSICEDKGVSF